MVPSDEEAIALDKLGDGWITGSKGRAQYRYISESTEPLLVEHWEYVNNLILEIVPIVLLCSGSTMKIIALPSLHLETKRSMSNYIVVGLRNRTPVLRQVIIRLSRRNLVRHKCSTVIVPLAAFLEVAENLWIRIQITVIHTRCTSMQLRSFLRGISLHQKYWGQEWFWIEEGSQWFDDWNKTWRLTPVAFLQSQHYIGSLQDI